YGRRWFGRDALRADVQSRCRADRRGNAANEWTRASSIPEEQSQTGKAADRPAHRPGERSRLQHRQRADRCLSLQASQSGRVEEVPGKGDSVRSPTVSEGNSREELATDEHRFT